LLTVYVDPDEWTYLCIERVHSIPTGNHKEKEQVITLSPPNRFNK